MVLYWEPNGENIQKDLFFFFPKQKSENYVQDGNTEWTLKACNANSE